MQSSMSIDLLIQEKCSAGQLSKISTSSSVNRIVSKTPT